MQVYFDVARIGAESFFRSSLAEAAGLEVVEELFAEIGDETLEPPADGGFVNVKDAGDLEQGLAIKEIGGEQKAVFRRESLEGFGDGMGQVNQFGGDWRGGNCWCRSVEGVERRLTVGAAMMIYVALGEGGSKPAEE